MRSDAHILRSGYIWAALAFAGIALTGFARTYYLRPLFGRPPLPLLLHVHGVIMSAWCILFFTQAYLVAAQRIDLHRRLGVFGGALAVLVVAMGAYVTVLATQREVQQGIIGPFHYLLGINMANLLAFAILVAAGLMLRRKPEFHKRLMLLATVAILAPAVARITLLFTHNGLAQFLSFYLCVLVCVVVDTLRHRRMHPAIAWGALLIIISFQASYSLVQTKAWMNFVARAFS
ncbi:MAG: hypothetical protein ACRD51_00515 [Candidatus Acidiferrum sp.]